MRLLFCTAMLITWACAARGADILDVVVLGDAVSEEAHGFTQADSLASEGGLDETCRRIGPNGHLTFDLACDPAELTYLTVKLWGSDTGRGQLYLYDGERRIGGYQAQPPEIDNLGGHRGPDPVLPGRWYYATLMIPDEMTAGRDSVTLRIGSAGAPTPYSAERKEADQTGLSRGIYAAYTTTDAFFTPPDERQGQAPEPAPALASPDGQPVMDYLHAQLDGAVDRFLTWQYYGDEWEQCVAEGKGLASLTGAITLHGRRDAAWTIEEYKDSLAAGLGGNRVTLLLPEIYARAYLARWSKHHGDPELIQRVVLALDYARLAQGANGGFDDIWEHRWVGGPERRRTGNCLEGFGHMGLPAAFLLLQEEIVEGDFLDAPIDDDGNADTPEIPRRQAWVDLFHNGRDYLTSDIGRGHAPNQDLADIVAACLDDQCLRLLAPELAWADDETRGFLEAACGTAPDVYGGHWISAKGVSCEPNGTINGGYCGNYGDLTDSLLRLAEITGEERLTERALQFARVQALFRYPSLDGELRPVLRTEGVITWRNNFTPGRIHYGGNPYAAVELGDPISLRLIQLAAEQGGYFRIEPFQPGPSNVHLPAVTAALLRQIDRLEEALQLPPTGARLPFETGEPDFAWADEQAACIIVKRGEERLLMSLNWRHGYGGRTDANLRAPENATANNVARVHFTTPTMERVANARMESVGGFGGLYVCRYGPYLVLMNADWSRNPANASGPMTYRLDGLPPEAVDLITGQAISLRDEITVPEETALVLYVGDGDSPHASLGTVP